MPKKSTIAILLVLVGAAFFSVVLHGFQGFQLPSGGKKIQMWRASPADDFFWVRDGLLFLSKPASTKITKVQFGHRIDRILARSPSGEIILLGVPSESKLTPGYDLWTYDTNSSAFRLIGKNVTSADLSPDAETVAYSTFKNELFLADSYGMRSLLIMTNAAYPQWSPNGERIAYVDVVGENQNISVLNLMTRQRETITSEFWDGPPEWTPDGDYIIFASASRTGLASFWIAPYPKSGKEVNQLTNLGSKQINPAFVPVGGPIAWLGPSLFAYGVNTHPIKEIWALEFEIGVGRAAQAAMIANGESPALSGTDLIFISPSGEVKSLSLREVISLLHSDRK